MKINMFSTDFSHDCLHGSRPPAGTDFRTVLLHQSYTQGDVASLRAFLVNNRLHICANTVEA